MALLGSCGGGGGSGPSGNGGQTPAPSPAPSTGACSLLSRQNWALAQLQEWYLFPTLFNAAANPASYTTLLDYVDALVAPARAANRDRYFTYVTSIAEENAYYRQGASAGFGIRFSYQGTQLFVSEAFEGAPALAQGIDRGTEILQIGGQTVASLIASGGSNAVIQALGPDTVGTSRQLTVRDPSGVQRTVTVAKADYTLDPVSNRYGAKVLTDGAKKVGYINLRTFIDTANPDLTAAFADFKAQGVTELIIDLRYNGGGLLSVAELMGNLMALGRNGQVFGYVTFRDSKAAAENETSLFSVLPQSIAPTKIAFIGTGGTASASELIINAMVPYLGTQMALVGSNTYGKPVGQIALDRDQCDDRLRAIAFKFDNSARQGEYYNGLATTVPVSCRATDDVTRPLGDTNEGMIKASLDFLAGRGCTAIAGVTSTASVSTDRVGSAAERRLLTREMPESTFEREVPGAY